MRLFLKFLLIFLILLGVVFAKYYFWQHPSRYFFFLSNTDVMFKATEFLKKPTPFPYLQSYIEYPVVIAVWNTLFAYLSSTGKEFFFLNGIFLSLFSTLNILLSCEVFRIYRQKEVSPFIFLTPSLLFFTFYNWDALAVFFCLGSLVIFLKNRKILGALIATLGFWTKFFPVFSLLPFGFEFIRSRRFGDFVKIISVFGAISVLINFPFYFTSPQGWGVFFNFSSHRPPNLDSLWSGFYVATDRIFGPSFYYKKYYDLIVNWLYLGLFTLGAGFYYLKKIKKDLTVSPVVEVAFFISLFLLTSKVYSPQYNLWLLPLLIILNVNFRFLMIFEIANLVVIWAVFQYLQEVYLSGHQVLSFPLYKVIFIFVLLRHLFLFLLTREVWRKAFIKYEKIP